MGSTNKRSKKNLVVPSKKAVAAVAAPAVEKGELVRCSPCEQAAEAQQADTTRRERRIDRGSVPDAREQACRRGADCVRAGRALAGIVSDTDIVRRVVVK